MENDVPIISLTTDFGIRNGFVGVMKGVIWGICPHAQIADISHTIAPQDILEGAYTLWRAAPFYPPGSVHIAVVDPGVGTHRRPLGAKLGNQYYISPDNGLLSPLIDDAERNHLETKFISLDNPKYWLPKISRTFHGRDIFSPSGAHLAAGVPLEDLGSVITDPVRFKLSRPLRTSIGWQAHITVVDIFGNLTTDLQSVDILGAPDILFRIAGKEIRGLCESYGHKTPGDLIALVDSEDFIEIAVVNGSANQKLDCKVGDLVEVVVNK
jgi:S-adenosylmethionine hydrolase